MSGLGLRTTTSHQTRYLAESAAKVGKDPAIQAPAVDTKNVLAYTRRVGSPFATTARKGPIRMTRSQDRLHLSTVHEHAQEQPYGQPDTATAVLECMTRSWNRDPATVARGTLQTGVSAALWTSQDQSTLEVDASPTPDQHIVCLQFAPMKAEYWVDGRLHYSGHYGVGDVSIVPAGSKPRALLHGSFACLHIYVPDALVRGTLAAEHGPPRSDDVQILDPKRVHDPFVERVGRDIMSEVRESRPLSRSRVDALGMDVTVHMLRRYSTAGAAWTRERKTWKSGLAPWQVRRCTELINSDLCADHSLAELAAQVGLSAFHFARSFKLTMGVPPHAYLVRMRLDRARDLLLDTDLRVTEIALEVGYENSQALARAFRKRYSCSPVDFRRMHRK